MFRPPLSISEENEIIRLATQGLTVFEIARTIGNGRARSTVKKFLEMMKVPFVEKRKSDNIYTQEEVDVLKKNFHLGPKRCAELLPGRSLAAISVKAAKLGLKGKVASRKQESMR
jgi:hypothetical protein